MAAARSSHVSISIPSCHPLRSRPARRGIARVVLLTGTALLATGNAALAADATWTLTSGNGNWIDGANWNPGVPGINDGTFVNTDIATFNATITAARTVTVDAGRNIGGITFSHTSGQGYTLGTGPLNLTAGGTILSTGGSGTRTDSISAPIVIRGDGGSAFFTNNSTASGRVLSIGAVTGASTASNTTTLNLGGTSGTANVVTGVIGNGSGGGTLALVKDGAGLWAVSGANTFTGGVTISAGTLRVGNGGTTGTLGSNLITNNATLAFNRTDAALNFANNISGSGVVTQIGGGTVTLSGSNSYNGGTTITTGTLRFGTNAGSVPGTGQITIGGNGSLVAAGPTGFSNISDWIGSARIVTSSNGSLAITADTSDNLNFAASGYNTLGLGSAGAFTYSGTLTPGTGGYRLGGGGGTLTIPGGLNAATAVTILGGSTSGGVLFNAPSSYTGVTTINGGGTLTISHPNALGSTDAGVSTVGGTLQLQGGITTPAAENLVIRAVSSTGSATNNGNGLVNVSGANTWSGTITGDGDNSNNFRISNSGAAGAANALTITGNITSSGTFGTITGAGATGLVVSGAGDINIQGNITGAYGLVTTHTGIVRLQSDGSTFPGGVRFQGGSTFEVTSINGFNSGTNTPTLASSSLGAPATAAANAIVFAQNNTSANAGTLRYLGAGEATNRVLTLNGNSGGITLDQSGPSGTLEFLANLSATATGTKTLTLTGSTAGIGKFSGVIGGTGTINVVKSGTGTWLLSAVNTYTGSTAVNAGTLGGTGTIAGNVTVAAVGTLLGGDGAAPSGALTLGGGLTTSAGSTVSLVLGPTGSHSSIARTAGTVTFASGQSFAFIDAGAAPGFYDNLITNLAGDPGVAGFTIANPGWAGSFSFDGANVDLTLTAVPEPGAAVGLSVLAMGLLARRRRRHA